MLPSGAKLGWLFATISFLKTRQWRPCLTGRLGRANTRIPPLFSEQWFS